eukprot:scaffold36992_cov33-Prasinocladus_malaysianus.AAC.1
MPPLPTKDEKLLKPNSTSQLFGSAFHRSSDCTSHQCTACTGEKSSPNRARTLVRVHLLLRNPMGHEDLSSERTCTRTTCSRFE